jgi:hypothetical protein
MEDKLGAKASGLLIYPLGLSFSSQSSTRNLELQIPDSGTLEPMLRRKYTPVLRADSTSTPTYTHQCC